MWARIGGFRVLSENLNYSAKAPNTIFPNTLEEQGGTLMSTQATRKIANVIYANRMDNGDPSRDGWMFRGGGILQRIADIIIQNLERQSICL